MKRILLLALREFIDPAHLWFRVPEKPLTFPEIDPSIIPERRS